jgi:hypothetical protein
LAIHLQLLVRTGRQVRAALINNPLSSVRLDRRRLGEPAEGLATSPGCNDVVAGCVVIFNILQVKDRQSCITFSGTFVCVLAKSSGVIVCFLIAGAACGQDLVPRAYLVTPIRSNAVILSYSWNDGQIYFDPSVPIDDARGRFSTYILSYYHSFGMLGRSANIVLSAPYVKGELEGTVAGSRAQVLPSGTADARIRISVNLYGGRAMKVSDFRKWREKRLIGASVTVIVPSGQYDQARVINLGTNRWAFKPELGITRRWDRWVAEGYFGTWLYSGNPAFFPGISNRTQSLMFAFEGHIGYYVRPGLWASFDGNFWAGGHSSINGIAKKDSQRESRVGTTVSIPVSRHQSVKVSYSRGAYRQIGGNFQTLSAGWQYSWIGRSR